MAPKLEERPDIAESTVVRQGSILESAEMSQVSRNKDDYEHYAAKNAALILLIKTTGKRVVGDEILVTPPIVAIFSNHHFYVHKKHPLIDKVRAGIRGSDSWKNKAVFCVDDLDPKTARRLDPASYGSSTKQRLQALGVNSLSQLAQILEIAEDVDKPKSQAPGGTIPPIGRVAPAPGENAGVPPESRPLGRDELPQPEAADEDGKD